MQTLAPISDDQTEPSVSEVILANGCSISLEGMTLDDLQALQWDQEQKFAKAMLACPKGSEARTKITGQAYDTVCVIFAAQQEDDQPLVMGLDPRYVRLVLDILQQQINHGMGQPRLFEIGYGCGAMLEEVHGQGFPVMGVEISGTMREEAITRLGKKFADQLLLGDLRCVQPDSLPGRPSLVYWNDVFEHICPDEISDYLEHIYQMLPHGGTLVTVTPNWLLRPSDVTGDFCPPRTEANGLHLKEYRLSEVTRLLKEAGFHSVATPMVVSRKRVYQCGGGFRLAKQLCEPLMDWLPVRAAHLLCRGLGMSYTIATKFVR